jgi:hypothetical protein
MKQSTVLASLLFGYGFMLAYNAAKQSDIPTATYDKLQLGFLLAASSFAFVVITNK